MSQEPCKYFSGVCVVEAVKTVLCSTRDSEVWEMSQARYKCLISLMLKKKKKKKNSPELLTVTGVRQICTFSGKRPEREPAESSISQKRPWPRPDNQA